MRFVNLEKKFLGSNETQISNESKMNGNLSWICVHLEISENGERRWSWWRSSYT